jgi:hypothetical protein
MITITLADAPALWEPLNSVAGNMWFKLTSNTQSQTDFKYLFNPLILGVTSSQVKYDMGIYPVPEAPLDVNGLSGYGLFTAEKILREKVSYDLDPAIGVSISPLDQPQPMPNTYVPYRMRYGFAYNPGLTFANTIISGTAVGLTFAVPHNLVVGDVILINKSNKIVNPDYDGLKTVASVLGTWSVVLNYPVGLTAYVETGNIDYLERFTATSSIYYGFNGTRQYDQEYITDNSNYFRRRFNFTEFFAQDNSGVSRFLIDYYKDNDYQETTSTRLVPKKVYTTNYETLSTILNYYGSATYSNKWKIFTYTGQNQDNLTLSASYSFDMPIISTYSYHMYNFPSGPKNLQNMGVSLTNIDFYKLALYTTPGGNTIKSSFLYQVVNNCSVYDNVRLAFRNSFGAFEFWNFNLDSKNTTRVSRKEYKRNLPYQYDIGSRQQTIYSADINETWVVNTDWINEYDYAHLKELIKSTEVYLIDETSLYLKTGNILYDWIGGEYLAGGYDVLKYPIVITDDTYEVKTTYRNKQFNLVISYKMANGVVTQNR